MELKNPIVELNKIAGFMTSDSDLWITNRYEKLHLINVLAIQQRMSALERDIDDIVRYENSLISGEACAPPEQSSVKLLAELQETTKAYGDAIASLAVIRETESPAQHIVEHLKAYGQCSALVASLCSRRPQLDATQDLLSIATGSRSWFHRLVGRHERLCRMFGAKHQGRLFVKYSEKRVRNVEFGIVATSLCLVQLLPVLALTLVSSKAVRLTVIIVLIVLVSLLNAMFANTVRATNFGAIAAYSAIVVVFVSQSN